MSDFARGWICGVMFITFVVIFILVLCVIISKVLEKMLPDDEKISSSNLTDLPKGNDEMYNAMNNFKIVNKD